MKFQWRDGYSVKGLTAAKARAEIERLRKMNGGRVTPPLVVDSARSVRSPLHRAFCWDDTRAAQLWRLSQARDVIAGIVVVTRDVGPVREYVNLCRDGEYAPTVEIMDRNDSVRCDVLDRMLDELQGMVTRYGAHRKLAGLVGEVRLIVGDRKSVV